ncbi:citrate synthase-like protein [Schizophyllum amplum]|uniref:ATP citrate synthase n=1 Tax=Schizophyllum amplum TaxID=97359 RepID=A0A550C4D4_9AGAR|nr:citrate synthase-like protein [Auriculariopsis ampla]
MSSKPIREYDAKLLLSYFLTRAPAPSKSYPPLSASYTPNAFPVAQAAQISWDEQAGTTVPAASALPAWAHSSKLVAKPDMLIKRRGKAGLLCLNKGLDESLGWINERAGKPCKVESTTGLLTNFIIEPFLPHPSENEFYVCITSGRDADTILFTHEGGVDIGDADAKSLKLDIPVLAVGEHGQAFPSREQIVKTLLPNVSADKADVLTDFILRLYAVYVDLHFAYLEINPLVVMDAKTPGGTPTVHFLDMAAKLDQTASPCRPEVGDCTRRQVIAGTEESKPAVGGKVQMDRGPPWYVFPAPFGRQLTKEEAYIQKLDASTGASLKLTVLNAEGRVWTMVAGGGASVYSGAPSEGQTYEYAKTILDLMTRGTPNPEGKILIIGGGIANFTNVAATFKGIIRALKEFKAPLTAHKVKIFVRRGGPNYQEGLKAMRLLGESLGVPIKVYGPDTHITEIPSQQKGSLQPARASARLTMVLQVDMNSAENSASIGEAGDNIVRFEGGQQGRTRPWYRPFDDKTRSFGMLDFDYSCGRDTPSKFTGDQGDLLPVYTSVEEAVQKHADVDVVVNFASSRSAIALIAEGVPERHAREILHLAKQKNVLIIGPATVGGIKPGCFRIGNSGGCSSQLSLLHLYRAGMSNELNNMLSLFTNGWHYEGIAIGGDRYPGSTFIDHLMRYEKDENCKMLVLLGEVGGVEEYRVVEAVKSGQITKPIVAWAIGTCAKMFTTEVQPADCKNRIMREAGFLVPDTFEELPTLLKSTYESLVKQGTIVPKAERDPPVIPMDYKWAQELGLIRKPAAFISTISDERGQELLYAGMRISDVFKEDIGVGAPLAAWATKFIEMVLMLTADHGPAVSGAMNTIVASRAGKDLISSLASGLLTIGSRFGGALDEAAAMFSNARDTGLTPREFVDNSRKANKLISGIGHKIKSVNNPDLRVELVKEYVRKNFPSHSLLDYALAVEKVTTSKKDTLILNVDGCIAVCFVDLLRDSGAFTPEEADEYIKIGTLNGLFVLGRSIGFIGHHLDQKRLRAPLYRHPADDIFINMADVNQPRVLGKMSS